VSLPQATCQTLRIYPMQARAKVRESIDCRRPNKPETKG
jgi:hypothetical protein